MNLAPLQIRLIVTTTSRSQISNHTSKQEVEIVEITCNLNLKEGEQAIADSRMSDHFLKGNTPADEIKVTDPPIGIKMPQIELLKKSHIRVSSEYWASQGN